MANKKKFSFYSVITALHEGQIIAYPTEAVFGLGCDPDNRQAIQKLFSLKQRSWKKGLILIACDYKQLMPYIDINKLTSFQKSIIFSNEMEFITWVVPAKKNIPEWLTGKFNSIAIRITQFDLVKKICCLYGKPLISTSANINGLEPCKTKEEVMTIFSNQVFIVDGFVGRFNNPSKIIDIKTGYLYRRG
ncbi:Threonylcarbamoyl-AMP synthase [Candidatus Arsenophonus lipoptenae]|uniref:Threonylcarbamoyl-AMP synthase n=1 Tax=Candidatus Arsenophonus lipoptenae TaxID=634113 RepID=A0A0X9W3E7_9GAMM|nr:Sua5/YciO/YrdC/YwlC family protein [Candidatus Arsenophonus lipoptenae]AMA65044.1 Threonylcarbamoyl-AMP synthase [Candidatus Arsenophonus lipoptenae]